MDLTGHNYAGGRGRIGRNGAAVGRMIAAYGRGDGAATNNEIA
jgi:hypothetical protein